MSWSQIEAQLRTLLMALGLFAVGKGWIADGNMQLVVGVVLWAAGAAWSAWVNRPTALVQAASAVDAVREIKVKPNDAGMAIDAATGPKVKATAL